MFTVKDAAPHLSAGQEDMPQVQCAQCHIPKGKDTLFTGVKFQRCTDCHKDEHTGQFAAAALREPVRPMPQP